MLQGGALFVPDIPTSREGNDHELSAANVIYIYPISSLNCQGTVAGVEYCYQEGSPSLNIFTMLVMSSRIQANGRDAFFVNGEIPIPTPNTPAGQCSGSICCDTYTFTTEQFELPQDDFALGFLTPSGGRQLVAFHSSSQLEYYAPGYQVIGSDIDSIITVGTLQIISLRILRLVVKGT